MRRVRFPAYMFLAGLITTVPFIPRPTATAAPAVALAPARQTITLGDVINVPGDVHPGPRAGCHLCDIQLMLEQSSRTTIMAAVSQAYHAALKREQQNGNFPQTDTTLTAAQMAIYRKVVKEARTAALSARLDLSKMTPDQLEKVYEIVHKHSKAKDRDDILASLRYSREIAEGISKPVVIKAEVKKGQVGLIHPDDGEWMSLEAAKEAYHKVKDNPAAWCALEPRWKSIAGQSRLFDLQSLTIPQQGDLFRALREIGPALGGLSNRFDTGFRGSDKRLKGLRDGNDFDIRVDADSLAKVPRVGKIAIDLLSGKWEVKDNVTGRVIEFLLAHRTKEGDLIERLIQDAKDGKLKGKHIVLMFCADFDKPKVLAKLMQLREAVLKGKSGKDGAASILMPSHELDVPAMTLAALALKNDPSLLDSGGTSSQVVQRVFLHTAEMLEECKKADDPLKAVGAMFKNERAADFFKKKDKADIIEAIDKTIDRLRSDWLFFHHFVQDAKKSPYRSA